MKTFKDYIAEEGEGGGTPTNNAGDGKVSGMGGSSGEPGVEVKKKKSLVMGLITRKLPNNI